MAQLFLAKTLHLDHIKNMVWVVLFGGVCSLSEQTIRSVILDSENWEIQYPLPTQLIIMKCSFYES